ncbi:MAG: hypothetical protein JXR05_05035 [Flavobacteriaceae bacterium]
MKKIIAIFLLLLVTSVAFAQEPTDTIPTSTKVTTNKNKGKFFAYWGWNRASYSNSDIHFKGENYDFTLYDVRAKDRPTKFGIVYFNPGTVTVPQTNYRLGYFFKENYTISLGVDHMKYVMVQDQVARIDGTINTGSPFDGVYSNQNILLEEDFLEFEHTDGLNYISLEVKRFDEFGHLLGISSPNFQLNVTEGLGGGLLFPRTNTTLLGKERYDEFHVSGWGVSASVGLNITFLKHFFIQSDLKVGYINMPNIRTTNSAADSASQSFSFVQNTLVFGGKFRIF